MQNKIEKLKREYKLDEDHYNETSEKLNLELSKDLERFNDYFDKHKKSNQ